jgi:cysteine-rich repeat protein
MRAVVVVGVLLAASTSFARPLAHEGWHVTADRITRVPAQAWGQREARGAVRDGAVAERVARQFLADHIAELAPGSTSADFVVVANQLDGELRSIGFAQTSRGVPVLGGQLGLVFGHDRLFAITSTTFPNVNVAPLGGRAILPIVRGRDVTYHAVKIVERKAFGEHWQIYIDAAGNELGRKSLVMTESSTLQFTAGVRYGTGSRAAFPAPDAAITANSVATITAADGTFAWTGTSPATVVPSLIGTYVRIINYGAGVTGTLSAQDAQPVVWDLATDELDDAQLSAYIYANAAKVRARRVNPSALTWINGRINVYVNGMSSSSCSNAASDGESIYFWRATAICGNTARIADVVYHEFAHSLHKQSVIAGMGDWEVALSEGLADFYSAMITEDSGLGRGFFLNDAPLRELDPVGSEAIYPQHVNSDPHITGLIIGGALWDLRKLLIANLGATAGVAATERVFTGIMKRAPTIPGTYMAALIADDDDSDLGNGTPNLCAIDSAFRAHGLYVAMTSPPIGPVEVNDHAITVAVTASSACLQPTSIDVTWQSSAGASGSFALSPQGSMWSGTFPAQPDKTVVSYTVVAHLADGTTSTLPDNPGDPMYQAFIGKTTPIWCENMDQDPMWTLASAQHTVAWIWGQPRGGLDPETAHTGTHVLGTVLAGDGLYLPDDFMYAETPIMDLTPFENVRIQYRRWLTADREDEAMVTARPDSVIATTQTTKVWHSSTAELHADKEWRFHDIDISEMAHGGPMFLRWVLKTSAGTNLGGWNLDDVCVVTADDSVCGDHEISETEQCDDGNRDDGDGCSKLCEVEGGCCSASTNPVGPLVLGLLLGLRLRRRRRA